MRGSPAKPKGWRRYLDASPTPGDFSVAGLRARCAQQRDHLEARGWATEAELAAAWPGGADNADRGLAGWFHCAWNYARFMGRAEDRYVESDVATAIMRAALADALADRPETVETTIGPVTVYPKSAFALAECDRLDAAVARLTVRDAALRDPTAPEVLLSAPVLRSLDVRVWVWIATDPRAELPYADGEMDPKHPDWIWRLTPQDLLILQLAFRAINRRRNAVLLRFFPKEPHARASRLGFDGFLGSFAAAHDLDPLDVNRRWRLGRALGLSLSEAITGDEARERAQASAARAGSGKAA